MNLVPYSFVTPTLQEPTEEAVLPGQYQGVYISWSGPDYQFILNKIVGWFADRDEVELIDHGVSDKLGDGYVILEWAECEIDPLFLAILRDEEMVTDYTIYLRDSVERME